MSIAYGSEERLVKDFKAEFEAAGKPLNFHANETWMVFVGDSRHFNASWTLW